MDKTGKLTEMNREEVVESSAPLQGGIALDAGPFYYSTKAGLKPGDLLEPGYGPNYSGRQEVNCVYPTATLDAAVWGVEPTMGDGPGRIYLVEPTGAFKNDPNLINEKFPRSPARPYRIRQPLRVLGGALEWEGHSPEVLQKMLDHLDALKHLGIEAAND